MQKFLRTMLLMALIAMPVATYAQDRVVLDEDFSVVSPEGWNGGTAAFGSYFTPSGAPSWNYEDVVNQGFAAGHYTVNLYAPNRYYWAVTPAMDLSQLKEATLTFGMGLVDFTTGAAPTSVDSGKVVAVYYRVGSGSWQVLARWSNEEGDSAFSTIGATLTEFALELPEAALAENVRIAFYAGNTTTRLSSVNVYLDDVNVSGNLKCLPVTSLAVTDIEANGATIEWEDELNPAPSFYRIALVVDGEDSIVASVDALAAHTYTFEGLNANTDYTVRLYTHNSQTVRSEAAVLEFTTAPSCPAVENLAIDEELTVGTTVVLKWDAIEGASYIVSNGDTAMTVTGATATFEGLEALQTYTFTVRPICGESDTARTQEMRSITHRVIPEDLCMLTLNMHDSYGDGWNGGHIEMRNGTGVVLQDATFPNDNGYKGDMEKTEEFFVAYGATVEFYIIHGSYASEESFELLDAQGNIVFSGNGYSSSQNNTNALFYTFLCGKYAPVENLAVSEIVPTSVTLTWENPNDEQELTYAVRLFDAEGALVDSIATTELSYSKDGLAHSTDYTIIVGVVDGEMLIDATLEFSTPELCPGPVNFAVADYGRSYVNLAWESIYENMNFELVKSEEALDAEALAAVTPMVVTGNEYTFSDLDRGSQYYFYLRSACGEQNSLWRNVEVKTNSLIQCGDDAIEGPTVAEGAQQPAGKYIPIYGYYCDATYNRSQSIYPASMLEELAGSTISSLKYKVGEGGSNNWATAVWTVKMGITTMENLASSFDNETEFTTVYTGTLTASEADGMTINFDEPFLYTGGNLIVEISKNQSSGWTDIYFCGTVDDVPTASRYMSGSSADGAGTAYGFLPQVTFGICVFAEACPTVAEINISELAEQTATLAWERPDADYLSGYEYILSETEVTDFEAVQATGTLAATATSIELNGLEQGTYYYFYLRAICERDSAQSEWAALKFRTLEACRAAENIEVAVTGKHTAHATWTNGGADLEQASNYSIVIATEANLDVDALDDKEPAVEALDATEYDFADLESGTTYYMYVRNVCMIDDIIELEGSWIMSEAFTMPIALPAVANLQGTTYNGSISVTWENDASLYADQSQWKVAIRETADDSTETTWITVDEPEYTFLSLDADKEYTVTVVAVEGDEMSEAVEAQFTTLAFSGCALTFETATQSNGYVPFETYYLDTKQHSQIIYTAEDMPAEMVGAEINSISFYTSGGQTWTWSEQALEIRVMATDESSITSDFIDIEGATLVNGASGIAIVNDVLTLEFDTPFVYNGGNILIDMNVTEAGNYLNIQYLGITKTGASRYQRSAGSATTYNFLPKTSFCYTKNPEGCVSMNASNIVVSDVTTSSANVSWKPGYQETEWEYAYSMTKEPENNTVTTSLKANLSGLERNVDYNFFVRPVCGENTGDWSMITFATGFDCAEPVNLTVSDITTESATLTAMAGELGTPESMTFRVWKDGAESEAIEIVPEAVEVVDSNIVAIEETGDTIEVEVTTYELGDLVSWYFDEEIGDYVEIYDTIWNTEVVAMPVIDTTYEYVYNTIFVGSVEGLQGSTFYNFAAASNCGEVDGESRFCTPVVFGTQCNGEVSLPLNEDFTANSLTKDCWEVIVVDSLDVEFSEPTIQSDILWVAGTTTSWSSDEYFERYVISPKFEGNAEMVWKSNMSANNYTSYADSCEFGYSTTTNDLESFVWIDKTSRYSYSNTLYDFQYFIPADAKYVAYHFRGQKADWMRINTIEIRELESYHMAATNADPELGKLYVIVNGDTADLAESYDMAVNELKPLTILPSANEGYHVDNWTMSNGDTLRSSYGTILTGAIVYTVGKDNPDTNLTVHFKIDPYEMQLAVNNEELGSVYMDRAATDAEDYVRLDTANVYGTEVTVHAVDADAEDGYVFRGWSKSNYNKENNIVSYDNPYTFIMDGNYTLTAVFVIDSNYVTVDYNEEMGVVTGAGVHATNEASFTMTAEANYGYEFVKWTGENGFETTEASFDTTNTGDMSFAAEFQTLPYYLQVASNDAELGTAEASALEGQYMDEIVLTATPVAEHYHFQYWSDGTTENPYNFHITQDTMMRAYFVIDTHQVQLYANELKGMVTLNGTDETEQYFDYGTEVEIEAIPNVGVAFTQWSDGFAEAKRTITVANDMMLEAEFDSILYNIVVNYAENEGTVSMEEEAIENGASIEDKLYGETVVLTAEASTGYVFANWTDAEGNIYEDATIEYTVNANEQQTLTANFAEGGKVNVNLLADAEMGSVMGTGSYNNSVQTTEDEWNRFDENSNFTMVATPADHYHFVAWMNGEEVASEDAEYEIVLPEGGVAISYTAIFALDTHLVKAVAENGSFKMNGVAADSVYVNYGSTIEVEAVNAPHYHFVGWENDTTTTTTRTVAIVSDTILSANFEIDVYAVTFASNNTEFGTVTAEGQETIAEDGTYMFGYGSTAKFTATANTGYHLVSWNNEATTESIEFVVLNDESIEATFDTNVYNVEATVNDEAMGSVAGAATMKHFQSAIYTATANTGYHFVNWTNAEGEVLSTEESLTIAAVNDTAFVANFDYNQYTVTVEANDGLFGTVTGDTTANYLSEVELTATANTGYHFVNWSNGETESNITYTIPAENSTLTANFDTNVYAVTTTVNVAAMGSVEGAAEMKHFTTEEYTAVANNGYHFVNWTNANGDVIGEDEVLTVAAVSDTAFVANFAKNVYSATVAANDATMGQVMVSNAAPEYLDSVTFSAMPNQHYRFVNWSNGMTDSIIKVEVTGDIAMIANFESITFVVNVTANDATMGTVTPSGDSTVLEGSTFTATAVAAEGYEFVNWNTGETTATITKVITANTALVANFQVIPTVYYSVTVSAASAAMGTVTGSDSHVEEGTEVTVSATANAGYRFTGWMQGNQIVSEENPYTFTVTGDVTLVAQFIRVYTVTAQANNNTMGTVSPATASYDEGMDGMVEAQANNGYHFVAWVKTNTSDTISRNARYEFTATEDLNLTAVFAANPSEPQGIDDVDMSDVTIYSTDSKIIVRGAENHSIYVFDVNGRAVASETNATETTEFRMSATGVYLVKVGNAPAKRVLVVR